jgi:penicillin-insensitive murein DD-endopeptidase
MIENQSIPSEIVVNDQNHLIVKNAKRLPSKGRNYCTYSRFLSAIGRTHVHEKVRDAMLKSCKILEKRQPNVTFVYGETGWKNGGNFWPHRTHRNGLCVDFIVPVREVANQKKPTTMFLWVLNAWGYNTRFDEVGCNASYSIDFYAIIEHLCALQESCQLFSLRIKQVIFDQPLLTLLKKEDVHQKLKTIPFADFKAWVPHDSHYHIEFEIIKKPE